MDFAEFFLPEDLKQRVRDGIVHFLARQAEKMPGGDKVADVIRQLSSQALFRKAFDEATVHAIKRFSTEYMLQDEDLVEAIITDCHFWQSKDVREALMTIVQRPGFWTVGEREIVVQHFADVLPKRINRERVDKAVLFLLRCITEALWTLPGVEEIRQVYSLQFQKVGLETAQRQVALLDAQLQATTHLSSEIRQALQQMIKILEQRLLVTPLSHPHLSSPHLPYHNLPQPDYTTFVGRQEELDWLYRLLSPHDRTWQIVITGIGGVGKSSLALAAAHYYHDYYHDLPKEERFEAIIWITAKDEVLTIGGRKSSVTAGLTLRTLEEMYTTIAQTLDREDITRAFPEEQTHLVQKALGTQRTLLIIDNLENIVDARVPAFLYHVTAPTKCLITSREWVDVAAVRRLRGLSPEDAQKLMNEEIAARRSVGSFAISEAQKHTLFKRTEGLPLAIKLSIARLASGETFEQVLRWLGDASGDLPDYCVKGQIDIARQHDPLAWKLLLVCSLFDRSTGVAREALGAIGDLSRADRDDGLTLLQRLSLLNQTGGDRFWLLPLVQEYLLAELSKETFGDVLTEHWLQWLLQFAQNYGIDLELHVERAQIVGVEYCNLLSALSWCQEHERWGILVQLAEGIWFYPHLVGLLTEEYEILTTAIKATKKLQDEQSEGRFVRRLGLLFWVQGRYEKALECLDQAEAIAAHFHNELELGLSYFIRADILFKQGSVTEAEHLAEVILQTGERFDDLEQKHLAIYRFSEFESKQGHFEKALEWLDRGLIWCRDSDFGRTRRVAYINYLRGSVLFRQGKSTDAESFLMQSLHMATSWGERPLIAHNELLLIQVYLDTGRLQLARQVAEEAYDLFERLGMGTELTEVEDLLRKLP